MISIPSPVEGVSIQLDVRMGLWSISTGARVFTLRPWTWRERRRMVRAAVLDGTVDRRILMDGILDLLVEPGPDDPAKTLIATAALYLLVERDPAPAIPLSRRELVLTTALGWRPHELEAEDVTTLDELAAQLDPSGIESEAQEAVPEGWTRIVFPDSPAKEPPKPEVLQPTGGDAIAQVVAQWAGLPSRSPAAFIVQPPPTGEPAKEAGAEPEPAAVSSGEQPEDPPTFAASTLSQPVTHSGRADWTVPPRTAARLPMPHREARRSEPAAFPEPKDSRTQPPAQWETTPRFRLAASRPIRAAAGPGARVQVRWPEVSPPEEPAPTPNIFRIAPSLTVGSAAWPVEQAHPERHSESMAAPPAIPDDPFADSALEERLAGVFERAARESGVDVL